MNAIFSSAAAKPDASARPKESAVTFNTFLIFEFP